MELFTQILGAVFVGCLWLFMLISGNYHAKSGIFHNYYSSSCDAARKRSILWPILGNTLQACAMVMFYLMATDSDIIGDIALGHIIFGLFVPIALSWSSFGGFDFTTLEGEE